MTKFEINHNIDAEEGLPDTEMARKFQEAVKKKKAENNLDYKGDNPETSKEVIHDLGVFGVYGELEEKAEEPKSQEQMEDDLIKAALGENVFERPDKELEKSKPHYKDAYDEQIVSMTLKLKGLENPSELFNKKATAEQKEERQKLIETLKHGIEEAKLRKEKIGKKIKDKKPERTEIKSKQPGKKEKHYIYKEVNRLGENIGLVKKELREAKTDEEKKIARAKLESSITEFEKSKEAWNRIKDSSKISGKKETKIRSQVEIDTAESQLKTYGKKFLTEESTPEDLKEFISKEKEIKREQKTQKENVSDLTMSKGRQEEINKVWQKEVLNNEKEGEKFDLTTPEGRQKEIERVQQEEAEKLLTAADKQEEKIEEEIKQEKSWIREKVEKTANWYKKQPLWKKVLFSFSCIGVASASATLGGAAGATIAAAAFTGSIGQRALGGLATFITVEGVLKKSAEKGGKERTKAEAARHTVEAAVLGLLVGSGQFARGVKEIADVTGASDLLKNAYEFWIPKSEIKIMPSIKMSPEEFHNRYPGLKYSTGIEDADIKLKAAIGVEASQPIAPVEELKANVLEIGDRGPEGAIIDYFGENPDIAVEKFGCPKELYGPNGEITDLDKFNEWAGIKAHQLWLADAKEALTKPETLGKLKELGYPQDAEGYAKMMHRIGKGSVELDFKTGKINLANDTEYLKARIDAGKGGQLLVDKTHGGGIKVPPEYFDGSKKMLYEEDIDRLNKKYSGTIKTSENSNVGVFDNVKNWLENKAKIDVKKSSWLTEKFLGNHKVGEILDPGFAKPQGVEAYTTAEPEYGSPQWWELKEKSGLQNQIGKILRSMPIGERAKFQNVSVINFLKEYIGAGDKK